jgi:hypothetical protein
MAQGAEREGNGSRNHFTLPINSRSRGFFLNFQFWPDRQTAQEAIGLASEVRRLVLGAVSPAARP